jgi:Family of unknown function (DUF6158)
MTDSYRDEDRRATEAVDVTVTVVGDEVGIDPAALTDEDVIRELQSLHRTRLDTLRHGSDPALANHLRRTAELETEYLARHPGREVEASRLRDGDDER